MTKLEETIQDIKEIKEILQEIKTDNIIIKKELYGNGKKGLITRMEEAETKLNNNSKYLYSIGIIASFIAFIPSIKSILKILFD